MRGRNDEVGSETDSTIGLAELLVVIRPAVWPGIRLRLWIPAFAGMTIREIDGIPRHYRSHVTSFSYR